MTSAFRRGKAVQGGRTILVIASLTLAIGLAAPALAQVPSMLGAPGLSPVAPDAAAPTVAAPPAVSAPPALSAPGAASGPVSSCDASMVKLQQRRNGAIGQINQMMKGGKGKKLDPSAACPRFRNLVAAENEMRNWMLKNKDWCSIPDHVIEDMKKGFARTPVIANQACNAAAQMAKMKRMQAQQAQQVRTAGPGAPAAVKLPSGPL